MKNFLLIIFTISSLSLFCGTISGWTERYFNAADNHEEKLDALKFIHCQPVVDQFDSDRTDLVLLDSLLMDALSKRDSIEGPEKYVINLIFKTYVRFNLQDFEELDITQSFAEMTEMSKKEFIRTVKNIPNDANVRKDKNLGNSHEMYAAQIAQEINEIYQ